jgi:hypothetical protein
MHPDAIKLATNLAQDLAAFNLAKMRLEYTVQAIRDKGLAPNTDGTLPDSLGVENGTIGGNSSTLSAQDYAFALGGLAAMVEGITQDLAPGLTIEAALVRYMAV